MAEWQECRWGDVATLAYGKSLSGYQGAECSAVRVFGTNGPIGYTDKFLAKGPGVVIGRKGAYRGIHYSPGDFYVIDTAFFLQPLIEMDMRWAYYELLTHDINGMDSGSAIPSTSREAFYAMPLLLPPLPEQRAVAKVLGALDDKIDSNRRIGRIIDPLIANLFRSICKPEDEFDFLPALADVYKGVSYRSADLGPSSTAMVTLKSFDRTGGYRADGLKPYTGDFKPAQEVSAGDLAVAQTDLTQGAEVVGRVIRIPPVREFQRLIASLDLAVLRPRPGWSAEYLYGVLRSEAFRENCRRRTSGTTVLHLASDAISSYRVPRVSSDRRDRFSEVARPLLEMQDSLSLETASLVSMRDALLPQLLSGRLRAPITADLAKAAS